MPLPRSGAFAHIFRLMEAFLHEHGVLADFWVVGGGRRAWNWLSHFFEVFISNSINFSKQLFDGSLCPKVSLPGPTHTGMVYGAKRSTWEHTLFELKTHKCFLRVLSWKPLPRNVTLQAPCKRTQHCWPTTPNFVGCYMLRPFAHPVASWWMLLRVVAQSLKPVKGWGQTDATTPNIVAPTTLGVVACVLAVVCKRMQQLLTMLGPAVHRGKDATHKSL